MVDSYWGVSRIHSFGLNAAVGELTCLAATVLWLPVLLANMEARRAQRPLATTSSSG